MSQCHTSSLRRKPISKSLYKSVIIPRLDNEIGSALLQSAHGKVNIGIGGEEHKARTRPTLTQASKPIKPLIAIIDPSMKIHVEQDDIWSRTFCRSSHRIWRLRQEYVCKNSRHNKAHTLQYGAIIINDQ